MTTKTRHGKKTEGHIREPTSKIRKIVRHGTITSQLKKHSFEEIHKTDQKKIKTKITTNKPGKHTVSDRGHTAIKDKPRQREKK